MIHRLCRWLGLCRKDEERSALHQRADAAVERKDRVLEEFRRTERVIRGRPRVP